jgi:tryptophanyl-tRNA synthetase
VFPEPQAKLTSFPLVLGLDGTEKMSKSYTNHIEIAASPEEIMERVMTAFTDPARKYRSDPGHPDLCNIFRLHKFFTPARVEEIASECRKAGIGCVDCKKILAQNIGSNLEPFRQRRAILASKPNYVAEVLADGAGRAEVIAKDTIKEVKEKMRLL